AVAALPCDHVDDGALHVAELCGCADGLHLYFLNEINARFGPRLAAAGAGEIRAVDEKDVFVCAGTERRNAVGRHAARRRWRHARGRPDEIEHAEAARRNGFDIFRSEASLESAASCLDARTRTLDDDGFVDLCQVEDDGSLDRGADAYADVLLVIGLEALHFDVEGVIAGRQSGESQLSLVVCHHCFDAADERWRADAHDCTWKDGALGVFDGADQRSAQALRCDGVRLQQAGGYDDEGERNRCAHSGTPSQATPSGRSRLSFKIPLRSRHRGPASCDARNGLRRVNDEWNERYFRRTDTWPHRHLRQ